MKRSLDQLRNDARRIWQAGLDAVRSDRLVRDHVRVEGDILFVGEETISLRSVRRIVVVGAGKAGAGMAEGLEQALGAQVLAEKQVSGWINVPDDCVRPIRQIHLHGARPAGRNEPTEAGVAGAVEIRQLLESAASDDLCIVLVSGGASALLPDPVQGVSLADKLAITQYLSAAGANIKELNTVRKHLSRVKGGGLARACRAGRLIALVISDVSGDPLELIGSGPTVPDSSVPADALAVLDRFATRAAGITPAAIAYLESQRDQPAPAAPRCRIQNLIIGNNAAAVEAAGAEAERQGYSHAMVSSNTPEGPAEEVGRSLAVMALKMRDSAGPDCLISGGEPIVQLVPSERRGRGGRNQQLVLAAMQVLTEAGGEDIVLLSAGTDGEDGPTDAAGAFCDASIIAEARNRGLNLSDFLTRNDAYTLFDQLHALIRTGPTHTNVCDVRVVVVNRK